MMSTEPSSHAWKHNYLLSLFFISLPPFSAFQNSSSLLWHFMKLYAGLPMMLLLMMIAGPKMYLTLLLVTLQCHGKGLMCEFLTFLKLNSIIKLYSSFYCWFLCPLSDFSGAFLSHTFELEAKVKTMFYGAPAVITFRVPTKALLQVWHFILLHISYVCLTIFF